MEQNKDLSVKGRIFDIQQFSTHDGPGIRTIVFLKGCLLRCRWCCNPESQEYAIQTMVRGGKEEVVGRDVTVAEIFETVKKDMLYYRRSGGGITLSGGETLCQSEFALALLRTCKKYGINTAIETTLSTPFFMIEPLIEYIDTFLVDIKHMNSEKHEKFTTMKNELILQNAQRVSQLAKNFVVRVPVIPGFNDTEEEIKDIANFASTLHGVKEINLLPYHRLGYDKYIGLGREYTMGDVPPPTKEKMLILKKTAETFGLTVNIGG
ncbi:MAG: glycyl-radical enzyme activating protein [Ruminococcaceae bacterium]|nr:glycyl-radical enzyme activating protein [Oscillospiraceae bacterium]